MKKYVVGLMSGTSLDGIDAALVEIEDCGSETKVNLVAFCELPLEEAMREKIKRACMKESSDVEQICSLNFEMGYLFAQAVQKVCEKAGVTTDQLDFIGSHGQTLYHIPKDQESAKKSTLQIGEPAVIAYETKTTVVSNFRVMDMAAGGQGAPLVPYTEFLLYQSTKNRCLQNIGGIGNVTVIPAGGTVDDLVAFDTGPGNMIINEVVGQTKGIEFDVDGKFAAMGSVKEDLLDDLMNIPYITLPPPKTTGRELFGKQFVSKLLEDYGHLKAEDIIATVTAYTARSIAYNYKTYIFPHFKIEEVIVGGGGSYNKTLMKMLQDELPECLVRTQEEIGLSSSAKEAIAFAVLANETMNGKASNVLGATGAKKRVVLGNITQYTL